MFASPQSIGAKPYWPDPVLERHVLPAAKRAGIIKKIGWHSFRRTLATVLQSSGASVKTTQELMRHSSPVMTLGTYANRDFTCRTADLQRGDIYRHQWSPSILISPRRELTSVVHASGRR